MTIILEVSMPWHWTLGRYESELMVRYTIFCFAIGYLKVGFREFCETPQIWEK